MTARYYGDRVQADLEIALDRACERLSPIHGDHPVRKFVAQKLIDAAEHGEHRLNELTALAKYAALEFEVRRRTEPVTNRS